MRSFGGMDIKAYSPVTDMPTVKIDRVRVEVIETLFGDVEYLVMGSMGQSGEWWPLCRPCANARAALEQKRALECQITAAKNKKIAR